MVKNIDIITHWILVNYVKDKKYFPAAQIGCVPCIYICKIKNRFPEKGLVLMTKKRNKYC